MSWKMVKLGEICKITSGGTPNREKKEYYDGGTIPWVKTGDLKTQYISSPKEFITSLGLQNSSAKLFPAETVLIALYGATIGNCSIVKNEVSTNQACGAILPSDRIISEYLYHFLCWNKPKFISQGVGGAQPNISGGILKLTTIPLPPLETQKRIVELLDRAQALIDKRKEQIGLMDQLIQSLFYDMFGDPDRDRSILTVELSSVCTKITDGTHQSPKWSKEGIPFLFVSNIKDRKINFNTTKYISQNEYEKLTKATPIEKGDVLYTVVGSYGNPALVRTGRKFAFQRHIGHLKPNISRINPIYLEFALNTTFVKRQADARATGVAQKTLILRELKKINIILPLIENQEVFAEHVQKIETQKQIMLGSLHELENNFNSLMQRAFKGEI